MGSREDDDYWNTKYAEASCHSHGDAEMYYDDDEAEWICLVCEDNNEFEEIVKHG